MISDAFLNKMFYINILIFIAFTKQMLNLMYLYILHGSLMQSVMFNHYNQLSQNVTKSVYCRITHSFTFMSAVTHYTKETNI